MHWNIDPSVKYNAGLTLLVSRPLRLVFALKQNKCTLERWCSHHRYVFLGIASLISLSFDLVSLLFQETEYSMSYFQNKYWFYSFHGNFSEEKMPAVGSDLLVLSNPRLTDAIPCSVPGSSHAGWLLDLVSPSSPRFALTLDSGPVCQIVQGLAPGFWWTFRLHFTWFIAQKLW